MDGLDFGELTDDQLVGLLRALLRECVARGGAVQAAAHSAGLDEAERAQIAREAAEREAAKLRAQERERVAREAAEAVRREREAREAAARAAEGEERRRREAVEEAERARVRAEEMRREAEEAVRKAGRREAEQKGWLRRFAELVDREPGAIHVMRAPTRHGWRVIVNEGADRYTDQHLVDYYPTTAVIHTTRSLMGRKKDLVALCAEFWALNPATEAVYLGSDYLWEEPARA